MSTTSGTRQEANHQCEVQPSDERRYETYLHLLVDLHRMFRVDRYLEIGVNKGHSLACVGAHTRILGVDPAPRVVGLDHPDWSVVAATSEVFFRDNDPVTLLGGQVDLAFVDGLHHAEVALADVLAIERIAHPGTVVLVHDVLPIDGPSSERQRTGMVWSGDVWKVVVLLRRHRPDLRVTTLDVAPTGMAVVTGFGSQPCDAWVADALAGILASNYADLVAIGLDEALGVQPATRDVLAELLGGRAVLRPGPVRPVARLDVQAGGRPDQPAGRPGEGAGTDRPRG